MIPKIIHYCWFGNNPHNTLIKKCIASWKKYLPDYRIIEWNEDNIDIESAEYLKFCYQNKQWAYVADYARLMALEMNGGFYLDTDMEVIKKIPSKFLEYDFIAGQEVDGTVSCGIIGTNKNNKVIKDLIEYYNTIILLEPIPVLLNEILGKNNKLNNAKYFIPPPNIFYPMNYKGELGDISESYTIHHWEGSWKNDKKWFYDEFVDFRSGNLLPNETSFLKKIQHLSFPSKIQLDQMGQLIKRLDDLTEVSPLLLLNIENKYKRITKNYIDNVFIHPKIFTLITFKEALFNNYLIKKGFSFYFKLMIKSILNKRTHWYSGD